MQWISHLSEHQSTVPHDVIFPHFYRSASLQGLRILLAEDEYLVARALKSYLNDAGATVVGPAASVRDSIRLLEANPLSGAILDIRLGQELAYSVADRLNASQVPFVFYSGDCSRIPERYANVRCIEKLRGPEELTSAMLAQVARDLAGLGRFTGSALSIDAMLPRLRGMARALVGDADAADAIVEEALRRVLSAANAGGSGANFPQLLANSIEEIWYAQKLSRPT